MWLVLIPLIPLVIIGLLVLPQVTKDRGQQISLTQERLSMLIVSERHSHE